MHSCRAAELLLLPALALPSCGHAEQVQGETHKRAGAAANLKSSGKKARSWCRAMSTCGEREGA